MTEDRVSLSVKEILTIKLCRSEWERFDLYRFLDPSGNDYRVIFYIGQSENAFRRIWRHLEDGFKGRSLVGKFVRVNWPTSMNFVTVLLDSDFFDPPTFDPHTSDSAYRGNSDIASRRTAVERSLIEAQHSCFNTAWNPQPVPVPPAYHLPNVDVPFPRHMRQMIRDACAAVEREERNRMRNMEW